MKTSTRVIFVLLTLLIVALVPAELFGQPVDASIMDRIVQDALAAWQVPGASVAIIRGDDVVYLKGLGVKDLGTQQPVTPDTIFAIGSTTKAFVTTAMAMLIDEGKMNWDDPVRKHVEYFHLSDPLADSNVTLRDTVSHRTGLSRNDLLWYASPWGREEIIRKIGHVNLSRPFRSTYQYQNIMFLTAGQAVAAAAKTSWEGFVRKRIFEPLGMTSANFSTTVAEKSVDHATPHIKDKEGRLKSVPWRNIDNVGPAGSINASARDLVRWVRFQLGGGAFEGRRLVSEANLTETHTPQTVIRLEGATRATNPHTNLMSYGLGWRLQDYHGRLLVSHAGRIDGFSALITLLPKEKLGIVFLSNRGNTQADAAVNNSIVDLLLGLPKTDWNKLLLEQVEKSEKESKARQKERLEKRHKDTKPSRELAAYTGTYEHPGYGSVNVSLENGSLVLSWSSFAAPLEHFHFDTFSIKHERLEDEQLLFALKADGEVATLSFLEISFAKAKKAKASGP